MVNYEKAWKELEKNIGDILSLKKNTTSADKDTLQLVQNSMNFIKATHTGKTSEGKE